MPATPYSFSQRLFIKHWNSIARHINRQATSMTLPLLDTTGNCNGFMNAYAFYSEHGNSAEFDALANLLQTPQAIPNLIKGYLNPESPHSKLASNLVYLVQIVHIVQAPWHSDKLIPASPQKKIWRIVQSPADIITILEQLPSETIINVNYNRHAALIQKIADQWILFEPNHGKYAYENVAQLAEAIYTFANALSEIYKKFILSEKELHEESKASSEFIIKLSYVAAKNAGLDIALDSPKLHFKEVLAAIYLGNKEADPAALTAIITAEHLNVNIPWCVDEWRAFKLLPVTIAIINDNIPMLDALIYSHHVNLNPIDALLDVTPLQLAVAFAGVKPEAITRLLNNKTSPNLSNSLRQTPLHYLFLQEIYKEEDAAVINLKYYIAATYTLKSLPGSSETVFNIADNLEVKDDQVTFVKLAPPRREILDLLLQAGADPTLTDSSGQTVLHLAALNPDINIIQLLLEKGCDPFQPTKKGWTPLHIACAMNHITVANLFLDKDPQTLVGLALLKKIVKANNNPLLLKKIEKIKPAKSWLPLFHAAKQADQKHEPLDEKKKNLPS